MSFYESHSHRRSRLSDNERTRPIYHSGPPQDSSPFYKRSINLPVEGGPPVARAATLNNLVIAGSKIFLILYKQIIRVIYESFLNNHRR